MAQKRAQCQYNAIMIFVIDKIEMCVCKRLFDFNTSGDERGSSTTTTFPKKIWLSICPRVLNFDVDKLLVNEYERTKAIVTLC